MKRVFLILVAGAVLAGLTVITVTRFGNRTLLQTVTKKVVSTLPPSSTPTPYPLPRSLSIPKLGIKTSVEHVGETPEGRMDVPEDAENVAWYQYGPKPGQSGNAVMAGHLDTPTGTAVFYRLNALIPGDEYSVTDALGETKTFVVTRKESFPDKGFPIQTVFGRTTETMLNLITCEGSFNPATKLYSDRLVVFGKLKNN